MSEAGDAHFVKLDFAFVFFERSCDDTFILNGVKTARGVCDLASNFEKLDTSSQDRELKGMQRLTIFRVPRWPLLRDLPNGSV